MLRLTLATTNISPRMTAKPSLRMFLVELGRSGMKIPVPAPAAGSGWVMAVDSVDVTVPGPIPFRVKTN
jgi:hypothetical protein